MVVNYNRVQTHYVSFDVGSGLDISHENDLMRLTEMRVETGLKGADLAHIFANKYSVNGYLQVWRGTQLIRTSENENALRDYRKHTPTHILAKLDYEEQINRELRGAWKYAQRDCLAF